jgi:hypothetical protein
MGADIAKVEPPRGEAGRTGMPASNCVRSRTRMPLRRPGDTGVTVIVELLVFISSDYTLRAAPRPHHCWPSASDSDQKKRHLLKMTAIFACRVAAIAQVLASCIASRGSDPIDEP